MHHAAPVRSARAFQPAANQRLSQLNRCIEHAAHLLPSQGPITVFVHHNTLHAFEDEPFEQAVLRGLATYGCQPYLAEGRYRELVASRRIRADDIAAVLLDDLGDSADELIGFMGTRFGLRMAMLEHPLRFGSDAEIRWLIAESDALTRFRRETPDDLRRSLIEETRRWIVCERERSMERPQPSNRHAVDDLVDQFGRRGMGSWSEATWEAFTLHLLWRICQHGVHTVPRGPEPDRPSVRHRALLLQTLGVDIDQPVGELLIQYCAAYLDQGYSTWPLPQRERGFFHSFLQINRLNRWGDVGWLRDLPAELRRIETAGLSPLESIDESLGMLGVDASEWDEYLTQTLLALPGWAGMLWQMETNAEWTVHPAPTGSLVEFLAIRLILERLALRFEIDRWLAPSCELAQVRGRLRKGLPHAPRVQVNQRAYLVFQLAQLRGWSLVHLDRMSKSQWSRLVLEIEAFSGVERRRVLHLAYERRYRNEALDAVAVHAAKPPVRPQDRPTFQLFTCIDDREESFRRHLEEIDANCETFAAAGFFAVAMYYRGAADAHYRPLCPNVIKPKHYVREEVAYSLRASSRQRAETRRVLGTASHHWHVQSRSFLGGMLTAVFGSLASAPLIARILLPRLTSRLRRAWGALVDPPPITELLLSRCADLPGPEDDHLGYCLDEMVDVVERVLRDVGLTRDFSRLVIILGHGSASLNNPHESAYNCGACSGGLGGPNARAFVQMANDPTVRQRLHARGLEIPDSTTFVGGFHNTCNDDVQYYDLHRIPISHRREFEAARATIDLARARDAHERSRRFESVALSLSPEQALEHVCQRSEDLSQARPEYNHATNALCLVGRRSRSRGLFLDRRAFLSDYDPTQDDDQSTILARILSAVIPVCAGISLEYYFSCVDPVGYGCGSKLPHNIVSLLGVMEGAASDLRPGLSQQMIEIHEPLRILFVIETTTQAMSRIIDGNPVIKRLVCNGWVQLATLSPNSPTIHLFRNGAFEVYDPERHTLPTVATSREWYAGQRGHLGFASVLGEGLATAPGTEELA